MDPADRTWLQKLTPVQKDAKLFSFWGGPKMDFAAMAHSVGPGWVYLLEDLCAKLFRLGWDGGLSQVKEKFGTLRFYWNDNIQDEIASNIADDVVSHAEWRSGQFCEACGRDGRVRGDGWLAARCMGCAIKEGYPLLDWEKNYVAEAQEGVGRADGHSDEGPGGGPVEPGSDAGGSEG